METNGAITDAPPTNDWRSYLTDDLKADPVVSGWAEKAAEKDVPGLIKGYAHLFKQQGNKIALPGKDAKPEELTALKTRLIEAGVLPAPIADAKAYVIAKPENLPEGLQWSDELSGKLGALLHKHQVPIGIVNDLVALHTEAMGGVAGAVKIDREAALAQLKAEHGEKYDERQAMVQRMIPGLFSEETLQWFDQTGLGNDPKFLSALLRLAPLAMQDSSFMETVPQKGGEISGEEANAEYAKVLSDPKHPHYEGFRKNDPKSLAYARELFVKAYGTERVTI